MIYDGANLIFCKGDGSSDEVSVPTGVSYLIGEVYI